LMDATLLALPQTQERLANVIPYGETILKKQTISYQERERLAIHATFLREGMTCRCFVSMRLMCPRSMSKNTRSYSSALAAKDLGGSLHAHSDGPGKGAVFILELPIQLESSAKFNAA
jgi:hypothetical protein